MFRPALLFLVVAACVDGSARSGSPGLTLARDSADSAFTLVQARGHAAMGVDQYTSSHRFESLPDGGRISVFGATLATPPAWHKSGLTWAIAVGSRVDFALPGFVHERDVPGTAVMAARGGSGSLTLPTRLSGRRATAPPDI